MRYKYKIWIRVFVNNNLKGEPKIQFLEVGVKKKITVEDEAEVV